MKKNTHINVTVDFTLWSLGTYDLRIPIHQTVQQMLLNFMNTLKVTKQPAVYAMKIPTKNLLLSDDDCLMDYPITDGDILIVL